MALNFIITYLIVSFLVFPVLHYFVSSFKSKAFHLSFIIKFYLHYFFKDSIFILFLTMQLLWSDVSTSTSSCHFFFFFLSILLILSCCLLREFFKLIFQFTNLFFFFWFLILGLCHWYIFLWSICSNDPAPVGVYHSVMSLFSFQCYWSIVNFKAVVISSVQPSGPVIHGEMPSQSLYFALFKIPWQWLLWNEHWASIEGCCVSPGHEHQGGPGPTQTQSGSHLQAFKGEAWLTEACLDF